MSDNVHFANCWIVGITGTSFNFVLLWLIGNRASVELKIYATALKYNCYIDICYAMTTMLTQMLPGWSNGFVFLVPAGPAQFFGQFLSTLMIAIYGALVHSSNGILTMLFVYRYLTICRKKMDGCMGHMIIWFGVCVIFVAYITIFYSTFTVYPTDGDAKLQMAAEQLAHLKKPLGSYYYVACVETSPMLNWINLFNLAVATGLFSIAVVLAIIINQHFKRHESTMTVKTKQMHSQLTRMLTVQISLPFLLYLLPYAMITVVTRLTKDEFIVTLVSTLYAVSLIVVSWTPVCNPLVACYFVRSFRTAILKSLKTFVKATISAEPVVQNVAVGNMIINHS